MTISTETKPLEGTPNSLLVNAFMVALQREQQRVIDQGTALMTEFVEAIELGLDTPIAPKPKAFIPQTPVLAVVKVATRPNPDFVLKPHLTTRPLKDNEALAALKQSLLKTTPTRRK